MNQLTDGNFHTEFIVSLARRMQPKVYLELGVYKGKTLCAVAPYCKKAIGVDTQRRCEYSGLFYQMTTKDFFTNHQETLEELELCFIDADHSFESVKDDFHRVYESLTMNGILILHDTFPENDEYKAPHLCGDTFKMVNYLKDKGIEAVTLPCPPGLTIVRKVVL